MKRLFILLGILFLSSVYNFSFAEEATSKANEISQQARVLYAQNNIDETLKLLKTKSEEELTAEDYLILGNIYQDQDNLNAAIMMYQKAIDKEPKAYKAHYNLGTIYLEQEQPNLALIELKKAVKYNDKFAYGYYNMGCAYLKLKKYGTAKYNFFRAIDNKADEPSFYYNLAYAYKMLNNEKNANTYLDIYNKLIERN